MKTLVLLVLLIVSLFLVKTSSAQTYKLDLIFEQDNLGVLDQLFAANGQIWTRSQHFGAILYDKHEDAFYNISQEGSSVLHIHGVYQDGQAYVYHNVNDKAYAFNSSDMSFDLITSPIKVFRRNFVYQKDKVYICTWSNASYDDLARLYLWDGAEDFQVLLESETIFYDIYVKNEQEIFAVQALSGSVGIGRVLKYNGEEISELAEIELDDDYFRYIYSNDGETFFIQSNKGFVYRYELDSSLLEEIWSDPAHDGRFARGMFAINNEDVFIFGLDGVLQVKVSSGEANLIFDSEGDHIINSGYYDQENDEAYFVSRLSGIYQLKLDEGGTNALSHLVEENLRVYPNPVSDRLNIELASLAKNVQVIDVSGRIIFSEDLESSSFSLDLSSFNSGIYFLRIETLNGVQNRKIVKK